MNEIQKDRMRMLSDKDDAPHILIIIGDKSRSWVRLADGYNSIETDLTIAMDHIILAAEYEKAVATKTKATKAAPERSTTLKNSNGESALKVTEMTSGTLKLEVLLKDKDMQNKILAFAKSLVKVHTVDS